MGPLCPNMKCVGGTPTHSVELLWEIVNTCYRSKFHVVGGKQDACLYRTQTTVNANTYMWVIA